MPSPLRLIVRADDAGCARATNEAIAEAVDHGVVRNVSVMAVGPELEHAAHLLRDRPEVAIGLHVTINAEWTRGPRWCPILPSDMLPSLVDADGAFTSSPATLHHRGFSLAELRAEIEVQYLRLLFNGLNPVYLDTHMGFEWLEGVPDLLASFAGERGLVLDTASTHPRLQVSAANLPRQIGRLGAGPYVLITHPGKLGPEMDAFANEDMPRGRVAAERELERQALCAEPLLDLVESGAVQLETYAPASSRPLQGASLS